MAAPFADLKKMVAGAKAEQRAREQEAKEKAATANHAHAKAVADHKLFIQAVGAVRPLPHRHRAQRKALALPLPPPIPRQRIADEQRVLLEALSDEFDFSTLLETDSHLSFKRPGLGTDVLRKLRRGDWAIQAQIDLHGLRREEAREALAGFVRQAAKQGVRCVRVVHGKGLGSPGKTPVLKQRVHSWLIQKAQVLAFVQAKPSEGGAGALVVLLGGSRATP